MSEINKSYRINTNIGTDLNAEYITIDANLVQDYDTFDILSVKIDSIDAYKLHNANYGVVVGRVLANNGFGVPNAKLSIFISSESEEGEKIRELYPFTNASSKDRKGVRYNLLPNEKVNDCHQVVGTFPNKRYALDNDVILEVFDKYYKYTTRTNGAGDYLIMGIPVGTHTLHMDLDLSDCGILSQRPRDFIYKGYTIEQFENPNMFKDGTSYSTLSQVFTQDQVVNVRPFWGNSSLGEEIGITRADINVAFKFEPTCVFIGSVVSDNSSQGISKKCIATENMGNMEELTTGEGTIEMIRKTMGGSVEEFQVKGTQLIDGNGIWCYQIPMNLDYMMTDEYGNMVPTDDPEKGIPTRTRVRFRVSMQDNEENVDNYFRAKVLVPHNPQNLEGGKYEGYDYEFGSMTKDESFRDLFWNNVYSVKSYIPRFQKRKVGGWKEKKFTGIKNCNFYGSNNPMPYNNIRIKLPFIFTVMCALIKVFIFIVSIINTLTSMLGNFLSDLGDTYIGIKKIKFGVYPFKKLYKKSLTLSMNVIKEGLCPDLENWYFAPMFKKNLWSPPKEPPKDYPAYDLLKQTLQKIRDASADDDIESIDYQNNEEMDNKGQEPVCLTVHTDYLIACVEMNLAMEYRVINFDFYNDWINGTLYFPRFMRYIRPKKTFLGITFMKSKVKGCMDDTKIFSKTRRYTQQCAMGYKNQIVDGRGVYTSVDNPLLSKRDIKKANNLHKQRGLSQKSIFGKNGGICHEQTTIRSQYVYYMKPCEWTYGTTPNARKVNLFATDIILLGSLNDCDINGVPQAFKYLSSTSYIMPTNLALTNMENSGWLYGTNKNTICSGKSYLTENDVKKDSRVNVISPNSGLTSEIMAFSGAQDSNFNVQYEDKELSDIIALTEAAGIAWNYTGPGQGDMDPSKMYYPGGHFLGLSCVNSQTNIKSCINLSRICEVGTTLSQRKEDITSIDTEGNISYTYTAPTGFISGDDIIGEDFRTMFATMNYKRLVATKTNPVTGYKMYDFSFVKPINFDGSFQSITNSNASKSLYNGIINVPEEDKTIWEKIGIDYNADSRPDYDKNENTNTQTRTIEDTSIDYYLYRFGLDYENLKKSDQMQQRKFLVTDGSKMYMPQYENSYYFYFGLKNGATAIDEFNKQFFSECENGKLAEKEPMVTISSKDDINMETGFAKITVSTTNLETPYQFIEISSDVKFEVDGEEVDYLLVRNGEESNHSDWLTQYMFVLSETCEFGTYTITIRDANDVVYSKTEKIGTDVISFESIAYAFNSTDHRKGNGVLIHQGGYIEVSNLTISGLEDGQKLKVYVDSTDNGVEYKNGEINTIRIPVNDIGEHELRVNYDRVDLLMQSFIIKDGSNLKLFMGSPNISSKEMTHETHPYGWWKNIESDEWWIERISTFNEVKEDKREETSSELKVFAVGGTKAVWGHPQNSKGINTEEIWNSEDISNWKGDYALDDEYVHYPTYLYNGSEVTHFSSIVYDGNMVMGNYEAILSGGIIEPKESEILQKGCGYIFKPLPEGDLQFHTYNGEGYTANTINDNGEEITEGLFYPSISYPSIDRPFYVDANFYCWERRSLEMVSDEMGETSPMLNDYEEGGRTEIAIHNGITYGGQYYKDSYVTNLNGSFDVSENDMYGVLESDDRVTQLSGYSKEVKYDENYLIVSGTSGVSSYGYEIIEGASNENSAQLSNSVYNVIDSNFADYVRFTVGDNYRIVGPVAEGGAYNENVSYYMAMSKDGLIFQRDEKYIYARSGKKTYYVFCTYTSKSVYDTEGAPVMVKITTDDNMDIGKPEKAWCTYNHTNADGEIVEFSSGKIKFNRKSKPKGVIALFEAVFKVCTGVSGVIDNRIDYKKANWANILEREKINRNHMYDSNNIYYAYGVIDNGENGKLYKIYPTPLKVTELKDIDISDLIVNPTSFDNVSGNGDTLSLAITASTTVGWECICDADWITITQPSGLGNTKTALIVEPNDTGKAREATIIVYYPIQNSTDDGVTVRIRQDVEEDNSIPYNAISIESGGTIELNNENNPLEQTGEMFITNDLVFGDDSTKRVKIVLPKMVLTAKYNDGLLNYSLYANISLVDENGNIVATSFDRTIVDKLTGQIAFDDLTTDIIPKTKYKLRFNWKMKCDFATEKEDVQTLNYTFYTTKDGLTYKIV